MKILLHELSPKDNFARDYQRKEELVNYPFDPVTEYADQELCFESKVEKWGNLIVMQVKKPELINTL